MREGLETVNRETRRESQSHPMEKRKARIQMYLECTRILILR